MRADDGRYGDAAAVDAAVADHELVPDGAPAADSEDRSARDRWWWVVALLLLLALFGCLIAQALFPTARDTTGKTPLKGLTPVFSIYGLTKPLGVAAGPDGEIAVADTGVAKVFLYDESGTMQARLGGELPDSKVFGVDGLMFHGDHVYVADWIMRRVWVFNRDGTVFDYFPKDPMAAEFGDEGFAPYDVEVFEGDILTTTKGAVFRFDGSTFALEGRFDQEEPLGIALSFTNGLAAAPDGSAVYVCDTLNRRLVAFAPDGSVLWTLGKPDVDAEIVSFFALPRGVVVTERGVLVSDTFRHELYLLDAEGSLLGRYGSRGVVDGQLNFPEGIDVAPDGLLYLADRENDRVQVLRLEEPLDADAALERKWRDSYVRVAD